jgi:hypothetical protein
MKYVLFALLVFGNAAMVAADSPFADPDEAATWRWIFERSGRLEHVERDGAGRVKWVGFRDEKNERGDYYKGSVDLDAEGRVVKLTCDAPHFTNDDYRRLAALKHLRVLTTWHNGWVKESDKSPYSGAGLIRLKALPLESFNVGGSWFNDEGMVAANDLPQLKELQVYHTRISNEGIHALRNNKHLRKLVVGPQYSQRITQAALDDIATLEKLEELDFNEVLLTSRGVEALSALSHQLKALKLEHVAISPDDLAKLRLVLPQTKIEYTAATDEQVRQMQAAEKERSR